MRSHLLWTLLILALVACSTAVLLSPDPPEEKVIVQTPGNSPKVLPTPIQLPVPGAQPLVPLDPTEGFQKAKGLSGYTAVLKLRNPIRGEGVTPGSLALFAMKCAGCHGPAGCGDFPRGWSIPPDLPDLHNMASYKLGAGELGLFPTIKYGIPETGMRPGKEYLTDRKIWQLVNLVAAIQTAQKSR